MISKTIQLENRNPRNRMSVVHWIPPEVEAVLDVDCNVGALLSYCARIAQDSRMTCS